MKKKKYSTLSEDTENSIGDKISTDESFVQYNLPIAERYEYATNIRYQPFWHVIDTL